MAIKKIVNNNNKKDYKELLVMMHQCNDKEVWLEIRSKKNGFSEFATLISNSEAKRLSKKMSIKIF